jgi:hypothetical protein
MNGPIRKPRIGLGLDGLEIALVFAGVLVVVGLLLESGPEMWQSFVKRQIPARDVVGGALVALGVFSEVSIGIFISRSAKREKMESDSIIAATGERAAEALKTAAEANLARAKIEQRMKPRILTEEGRQTLKDLLTAYSQMSVDIVVFDHHIAETLRFADQITSVFATANWRVVRQWESRKATYRIPGSSVLIALGIGHVTNESLDLAEKVARVLAAVDIDCGVSPATFGCKGDFEPGDFQLKFQKPLVVMGIRSVAPFRIQIGAKQLSPLQPPRIVRVGPKQ